MRGWMKVKREEKGLTQQFVASKCGITKQYYQAIEAGIRQRDLCTSLVMSLASAFNMSPVEIVELESRPLKE